MCEDDILLATCCNSLVDTQHIATMVFNMPRLCCKQVATVHVCELCICTWSVAPAARTQLTTMQCGHLLATMSHPMPLPVPCVCLAHVCIPCQIRFICHTPRDTSVLGWDGYAYFLANTLLCVFLQVGRSAACVTYAVVFLQACRVRWIDCRSTQ